MMSNPEVKKALSGSSTDEKLEELLKDLDISENDTMEDVARKSNAKVQKLVKYFTEEMANVKTSAVEEATKDTREKEAAKINKFAADNPGMKNPNVVAMMQPLYDQGESLEDAYAKACKGLDLDPKTGEEPQQETEEEKAAIEAKEAKAGKEAKEEKGAKQSIKSAVSGDEDDLEEEEEEEKPPLTLDDALAAADAAYVAKHGDPFEEKD